MATKPLVIVESPTKARTIEKFLGKEFVVRASYGHVRDLPNNAAEIPESIKKEKWSRLGINIEDNFSPLYIIPDSKKKHVKELKTQLKGASELLLATDEDREGESISWHLLQVLSPKVPVKRLVFHEITREAIDEALSTPRSVDENLVKAQETRRIVDRLFGYTVSPLLWKKVAPRLSAGRVQSVAMRLLVDRERERINFRRASYWDLKATFIKLSSKEAFEADLTQLGGKRVAIGKDFDPATGKLLPKADVVHLDESTASKLRTRLLQEKGRVLSVEEKPFSGKPAPPFTTSTLQQEANRKLGFGARRTMQVAQMLYENGLITYMRTDSTFLSDEALRGARVVIEREFGAEYLSPEPRLYKTQVKNAQEAHEAIRPASSHFAAPADVRAKFGEEGFKLYELIWKRTIASQMKDSKETRVSVEIGCSDAVFRASGKTIQFPGYLRAYVEGSDDPEAELADREKILPKLAVDEQVGTTTIEALSHETQPPARYTEGSLIKELERRGIGRPSTWATIVDVVLSREYAFKKGTALVPTFLAMALSALMERYLTSVIDYGFTARLEDDLDAISRGEAENLDYLRTFYFGNGHPGLKDLVQNGEEKIDPREINGLPLGVDVDGKALEVRIGRFGPFITNGEVRAGLPDMVAPDELSVERAQAILVEAAKGPESLGIHPEAGKPIYLKKGRFGPYVQLGDMVKGEEKPKMASLLPGMDAQSVNLEIAVKLLSLPKSIGKTEAGEDIVVSAGRFGPYIKAGGETRSIPLEQYSPLELTREQAIELLSQPKRRGRGAVQPKSLREVGKHPTTEVLIVLKSGRYGPYVTDGKLNASLPRGVDPMSLSVADAVGLLEARAAKVAEDEALGKSKTKRSRSKKKTAA